MSHKQPPKVDRPLGKAGLVAVVVVVDWW